MIHESDDRQITNGEATIKNFINKDLAVESEIEIQNVLLLLKLFVLQ